jgi:hypothetical protein
MGLRYHRQRGHGRVGFYSTRMTTSVAFESPEHGHKVVHSVVIAWGTCIACGPTAREHPTGKHVFLPAVGVHRTGWIRSLEDIRHLK